MQTRSKLPLTAAACAALLTLAVPAQGQRRPVPEIRLQEGREMRMPFSSVNSIRELSDGEVLVADVLERAVYLLDRTGTRRSPVGRNGPGPGEYTVPTTLLPLRADSTLLFDGSASRYLVIAPDGSITSSFRLQGEASHLATQIPRGTDPRGGVYVRERDGGEVVVPPGVDGNRSRIFRYDRATGQVQPVTTVYAPLPSMSGSGAAGAGAGPTEEAGSSFLPPPTPFRRADAWGVARDGRVGVVKEEVNRMIWHGLAGALMVGPTFQGRIDAVQSEDRLRFLQSWKESRAREGYDRELLDRMDESDLVWPDSFPSFQGGPALVDPSGNLWLPRTQPGELETAYDLVDGQGVIRMRVFLPLHTRLQGFGRETVFLVRTDAVGLEWIQRYAWPQRSRR